MDYASIFMERTIKLLDERFSNFSFNFLRKPIFEDDFYTYHIIIYHDFINVNNSTNGVTTQCKYFAFLKDKPNEVFLCYKESEQFKLMSELGAFKFREGIRIL